MIKHHPEQDDDEIYLGMLDFTHFDRVGWETKRQGLDSIEYEPGFLPVFIKRSEVEDELSKTTNPGICTYLERVLSSGSGEIKTTGRDQLRLVIEITECVQDLDDKRALYGFELHANVVPVKPDGELHNNSNFTWLTPMIVDTIRFLLDSGFRPENKVSSEFTVTTPGAPTNTRPIEETMNDYATGADAKFPEDLDVEPEKIIGKNEGYEIIEDPDPWRI